MHPRTLFDTELGARLAGQAKVGLASVVEDLLGLSLAKEHSAVDWSTRPLPEPWLRYAALDVEVLVELRNAIHDLLQDQGKLAWAEQEFAALADFTPAPARIDPWRRTSGMHRVRSRRQLAVVRELWQAREQLAQRRDIAPGRILPDAAIVAAATGPVASLEQMLTLPGFRGGPARRGARTWWQALEAAGRLPDTAPCPAQSLPTDTPPPARAWADKRRSPPRPRRAPRRRRARLFCCRGTPSLPGQWGAGPRAPPGPVYAGRPGRLGRLGPGPRGGGGRAGRPVAVACGLAG